MQYDPPSPYMGGPPQRKSRTQGESDHDSRPDSNQKTTGVQDDDRGIPIPIRQFLARQEVGKFDFGREFGIIKNQDEFKHRLEEYEAMNNDPKSCTDFPTDPKTRMEFALKIGKAIVNVDRASDATNKNTVAQRKPEEVQNEHNRDDEKPGGHKGSTAHSEPPKDTASDAVNHLNRLKTTEVEIMSWKIMVSLGIAAGVTQDLLY
ncbi:hypothetical protein FJTKL_08230 [Diaporthe vaccinii]|uniref:Uncharacterized protein n=1 Tax=Diaporthe vaccinii TaxID=105482 RepID=A0ABR4ES67_9PEZI